ncbi:uncharacterized protein LOC118479020 [Aplysia californica]|uniref:Uncharacterized protein LOC118479020 n=1 Tax=Aplysia californica TaxID=6500 RepID=A0ABM1W469_APLCA|nr:uncharacterized protein LOC118479020 [Aplysia californica]
MQSLARRPRIWLKIALAWILSLLFPIPQLFIFVQYTHGTKEDGTPRRVCGSNGYTSPWQRKVYYTFNMTYILVVPMIIMLYCYAHIVKVVWLRARNESSSLMAAPPPPMPSMSAGKSARKESSSPCSKQGRNHSSSSSSSESKTGRNSSVESKNSASNSCKMAASTSGTIVVTPNVVVTSDEQGGAGSPAKRKLASALSGQGQGHSRSGSTNSVHWARNVSSPDTDDACSDHREKERSPSAASTNRERERLAPDTLVKPQEKSQHLSAYPASPRMSVRRGLVTASKRRALVMTLTVVLSFLLCHTPYFFVNLVRIFSDYKIKIETLKTMSEFLVMVHSTLNPLLYGLFTLRQYHLFALLAFFKCIKPRQSSSKSKSKSRRRHFGEERHGLLSSVRSKLSRNGKVKTNFSSSSSSVSSRTKRASSGGVSGSSNQNFKHSLRARHGPTKLFPRSSKAATTTTAAAATSLSAPTSSPLPSPGAPPTTNNTSSPSPSSFSSSSFSFLNKFRRSPLSQLTGRGKKPKSKSKQSHETLLFANTGAIRMTGSVVAKPDDTECSELETSPLGSREFPPATCYGNHSVHNSPHSDLTVEADGLSRAPNLGSDVICACPKVSEYSDAIDTWTSPEEGEYMIGGLTRV